MDRQNVLFYFTDQQRWDTCGCYGQKLSVSPRLDAFASDGVLFEQAITCQPVCGPARAVLQTGRWPAQIGCHVNGRELPQDIPTLAKAFRKAGYVTGYCGKWHLASTDGVADFQRLTVPPERRGDFPISGLPAMYWNLLHMDMAVKCSAETARPISLTTTVRMP